MCHHREFRSWVRTGLSLELMEVEYDVGSLVQNLVLGNSQIRKAKDESEEHNMM